MLLHHADIRCGVGGPLVTIARATGASITGINFNAHQIRRGEERVRRAGLDGSCAFLYADYMDVPLDDGTFDALYSFEAVCHAPNRALAFREQYRLLKPGADAAIVDWCLTDAFDSANREHMDIRARIERHNATPELLTAGEYVEAVQSAGFEVIEAVDQQAEYGRLRLRREGARPLTIRSATGDRGRSGSHVGCGNGYFVLLYCVLHAGTRPQTSHIPR